MPKASFQIRILFGLASLVGLFLLTHINIQLNPSPKTQTLSVQFSSPQSGPEWVEREVTSVLERSLSRLDHLVQITSTSRAGSGSIQLIFDGNVSIDQARLEVSTMIRQLYTTLPAAVSYPQISYVSNYEEFPVLLTYGLIVESHQLPVQQLLDDQLVGPLTAMSGVRSVQITSVPEYELLVRLKTTVLEELGIDGQIVLNVLRKYAHVQNLGTVGSSSDDLMVPVHWSVRPDDLQLHDLKSQPVVKVSNRSLTLGDLATFDLRFAPLTRHHRINGEPRLGMTIFCDPQVNQIALARRIKAWMNDPPTTLVSHFRWSLERDSSAFLVKELSTIGLRMAAALMLLFAFLAAIYWRKKILGIILTGFVSTVATSIIVYYFLNLELHLYSLAGLTLSLGIVLDNLIIMAEHLRKGGGKKIFLALLASTLTTIGALSIIFFISPQYREQLTDFAMIFFINLGMSLVVSLFLLPSLIKKRAGIRRSRSFRGLRRFNRLFSGYMHWMSKRIWLPLTVLVLGFGLPFFLMPAQSKGEGQVAQAYNYIMEGYYGRKIHPLATKYLGGTLRLFHRKKDQFYFRHENQEETRLLLRAKMPFGGTMAQLNDIIRSIENYLLQYREFISFESRVSSSSDARIDIAFLDDVGKGIFPFQLKSQLERLAIGHGSADFQVYGVGLGFNNELRGPHLSTHLRLSGYKYDDLWKVAEQVRKKLLEHIRIQEVYINPVRNYFAPMNEFFQLEVDQRKLSQRGIASTEILQQWSKVPPDQGIITTLSDGHRALPVRMVTDDHLQNDIWHLRHSLRALDTVRQYKNVQITQMEKRQGSHDIVRADQRYQLFVEYDFIGNYRLSQRVKERALAEIVPTLPPGYHIEDQRYQGWWSQAEDDMVIIVLGSFLLIFFISAILFNSLRQALIPLILIPPSFIGIFLATNFIDFRFDQGGFAAMLLVAGLSVNAGIFIINDYNDLRKKRRNADTPTLFISAYHAKFIPILLTAISTILGLLPFIFFEAHQPFWYALAICTTAGLLFSFAGLIVFLPIFFGPPKHPRQVKKIQAR